MPPLRVLLADDCPDNRDSLALLLRAWGHDVWLVDDGPSALEAFPWFKPQAVLLDIGMPALSGWDVCRQLREQGYGGLIVAVTGYGRAQDLEHSRAAGFDAHLTKPVEPEELRRLLAKLPAG